MLMTGAMLPGGARAEATDECLLLVARSLGDSFLLVNWVEWLRTSANKRMWYGRRAVVMVR